MLMLSEPDRQRNARRKRRALPSGAVSEQMAAEAAYLAIRRNRFVSPVDFDHESGGGALPFGAEGADHAVQFGGHRGGGIRR
jgi:hypothetical protein